jgi:hypothetical protein
MFLLYSAHNQHVIQLEKTQNPHPTIPLKSLNLNNINNNLVSFISDILPSKLLNVFN